MEELEIYHDEADNPDPTKYLKLSRKTAGKLAKPLNELASLAVAINDGHEPRKLLPPSPHPSINEPHHRRGYMHKFDMKRPCENCPFRTD